MNHLYFRINNFRQPQRIGKIKYFIDLGVNEGRIVSNKREADLSALVHILRPNFGDGYVKIIPNSGNDRLYKASLTF